jgi:hypothetical protein
MSAMAAGYPIQLDVDPPAVQSRLTVFFRILMVIPHVIILMFMGLAQAVITFVAWWAIIITGKYPRGMYGFSVGVSRWSARVNGYFSLLTGVYPPFSTDDLAYPIRLTVAEETEGRNRLTTFFRIFMVIPHYIVLYFVNIAIQVVMFIAWVVALFTGRVPAGMHGFLAGGLRWQTRAIAYAMLLTDKYPPFDFS